MKLVDINNIESLNFKEYNDSSIYDSEVIKLQEELYNINSEYESFCFELFSQEPFIGIKGKDYIKNKKVLKLLDFTKLSHFFDTDNNLMNIYNENIADLERINVYYIHLIYKTVIQYLCSEINLIRIVKKNKYSNANELFNLYYEEQKDYKTNVLFDTLDTVFKLINNEDIKEETQKMIEEFYSKKEILLSLINENNNNSRKIELFLIRKNKNGGSYDDFMWYNNFLKECCAKIDKEENKKRLVLNRH